MWFWNGSAKIWETASNFELHTEIFKPLYVALFQEWNYSLLFFALIAVLIIAYMKKKIKINNELVLLIWFVVWFGIIISIYLTTFTFQYVMDQTGINRSMVQLLMFPVLMIILYTYKVLNARKN